MDVIVVDLDGKPVEVATDSKPDPATGELPTKAVTVGFAITEAMMTPLEDDKDAITQDDTMRRFDIARRAHGGGEVELSADDLALIFKRLFKRWFILPVVACQVKTLLDPKGAEQAAASK
jgi:hypothetical protein